MQNVKHWLTLATIALGLSGIFAITQILARTTDWFISVAAKNFHTVSLILHVNLSVLTWFFAISCLIFSLSGKTSKFSLYAASSGMALMVISPFVENGEAFLNNYVPFFDNKIFALGIVLIFISLVVESVRTAILSNSAEAKSLAMLLSFAFFVFAGYSPFNEEIKNSHAYFESAFWEFGHAIQFAYAQIMLICWVKLAEKLGVKNKSFEKLYFMPVILLAVSTTIITIISAPESAASHKLFSLQMIVLSGITPLVFGAMIIKKLAPKIRLKNFADPIFSALFFSILLFALGGALASAAAKFYMQGEESTIIPAHYHGSVIAVTVAAMGYIYLLLPKLKLKVSGKIANRQIWFYSTGQAIYIVCLAILGGHGAPRKTPGTHGIDVNQAVFHTMHFSGLLLMIGGFMFVWVILKSVLKQR